MSVGAWTLHGWNETKDAFKALEPENLTDEFAKYADCFEDYDVEFTISHLLEIHKIKLPAYSKSNKRCPGMACGSDWEDEKRW